MNISTTANECFGYVCALIAIALANIPGLVCAKAPNVVVIMTDDAGYNSYGFSAALNGRVADGETPNLDALASQSVVLKQGYVTAPLCSTSRAGLLTGQYPQQYGFENILGQTGNPAVDSGTQGLNPQMYPTMAQHLKGMGYSTGAIGKWHLGYADGLNRPLDAGFDEFYGFEGGSRDLFNTGGGPGAWMRRGDNSIEGSWKAQGDPTRYDPVKGRYLTDALGEESAAFINNHANDPNPFFLYIAHPAPHTPWSAKQIDLDRYAHISDPNLRMQAAMTYGLDRAIGDVTTALANNGIDDETIVIFLNDNGPPSTTGNVTSRPLNGHKGTGWEGGIRVPFTIKAPGLQPGVYDKPVTGYDILPTVYKQAGGDLSQITTDGYDVMPYLKGEAVDDPNKVYFWREVDVWAVRRGDWKLTGAYTGFTGALLYNLAVNPNETASSYNTEKPRVAEMLSLLAHWEATLAKPKWGPHGQKNQNLFDHFVFRNDVASTANWGTANQWRQAGTSTNVTANKADAYANGIFEFQVRNDADYTATNNMVRMTNQTFMLNQLRLTGEFTGNENRQGTINGLNLLFVKSLAGDLPQIRLAANSNGTAAKFAFQIDNELQLLDNLEITGDGTQNFVINGRIRDYYEPFAPTNPLITVPHDVIKSGTSRVTLTANNSFAGKLKINGGSVVVAGPSAAILGSSGIEINSGGNLTLNDGTITVPRIEIASGGSLSLNGGILKTVDVIGNLTNSSGIFSPNGSSAFSTISGNFTQNAGVLQIELGGTTAGTQYDRLIVGGDALMGGGLQVMLKNGFVPSLSQSFQILTAGAFEGLFTQHSLPALPGGLAWQVLYSTSGVTLAVRTAGIINSVIPIGDYNLDGQVDSADYTVWRDSLGSTTALAADGNGDSVVNDADYDVWKDHFGDAAGGMMSSLAGDFNRDGEVDLADYTVWRNGLGSAFAIDDYNVWKANFGNSSSPLAGDFNRNGTVDLADYTIWRDGLGAAFAIDDYSTWKANFSQIGAGSGFGGFSTVPEPSSFMLLMLGTLALEFKDLRKRRCVRQ